MRKVAVLGAGYVVKPMIDYFIDICKYEVIIATRTVSKAEKIIAGRPLGTPVSWTIDQVDALEKIIREVEIVVVMIPRSCHTVVAKLCLKHKTPMLTTDFKHPGIACFDEEAKKQETLILTELGEDPGLDNMGLKQMIDEVHSMEGKITKIDSYGAGLPSFEHNRNPWGYKFSWDPNGLMRSAVSPATYQVDGKVIEASANNTWAKVTLNPLSSADIGDGIVDMAEPIDLDGDGTLEIAVAEQQGALSVLTFNGTRINTETVNNKNDTGTNTDARVVVFNLDSSGSPEI
ncbi:MAG: saccharopine dehydrogenase NADP-binding domain-containing protein, partial [Bacteroidetes bacterium]|nr:saccharopine dehydrogenase NADP-binding domain-containing protein [Bacteroidota bacterium]